MRCSHCGHINPYENNFCGICGGVLSARWQASDATARASRVSLEESSTAGHVARLLVPEPASPESNRAEPSATTTALQPAEEDTEETKPLTEYEPAPPRTSLGGPSFLGLNEPAEGGDYSYLTDEEDSGGHAGAWILLILLAVLGALTWKEWQPIRGFVVDTALQHSSPRPGSITAKANPSDAQPSSDSSDQPTITVAKPESDSANAAESTASKPPDTAKPGTPSAKTPADSAQGENQTGAKTEKGEAAADKAENAETAKGSSPDKNSQSAAKSSVVENDTGNAQSKSDEAANDSSADSDKEVTSKSTRESAPSSKSRRAAEAVPAAGLLASGEKYLYGRGVPRNCNQALVYMRSAADQGNPEAMSHLGALYATGECAPFDRAAAYTWFAKAYEAKRSPLLERNMDMLWRDMSPQERQRFTR